MKIVHVLRNVLQRIYSFNKFLFIFRQISFKNLLKIAVYKKTWL